MQQVNIHKVSAYMAIEDYGKLLEKNYQFVLRFFRKKAPKRNDHEDLAQETFAEAWKSKDRYREQNKFEGWLLTLADRVWKRTLKHEHAKKRKGEQLFLEETEDLGIEAVQDLPTVDGLLTSKLFESLDALPTELQHMLLLKARGYPDNVCAKLLKINPSLAHRRIRQAREKLAEMVRP